MYVIKYVLAAVMMLAAANVATAAPAASPLDDQYVVVEETRVFGQFTGCNPQVGIPMNGRMFVCTTYGYSPTLSYPKAVVMKNKKGEYKVIINGQEYKGYFAEQKDNNISF